MGEKPRCHSDGELQGASGHILALDGRSDKRSCHERSWRAGRAARFSGTAGATGKSPFARAPCHCDRSDRPNPVSRAECRCVRTGSRSGGSRAAHGDSHPSERPGWVRFPNSALLDSLSSHAHRGFAAIGTALATDRRQRDGRTMASTRNARGWVMTRVLSFIMLVAGLCVLCVMMASEG